MPPAHQVVAGWSPERFERWAEESGPQTKAFITLLLNSRRHPQQAYRSCLGILGLAKQYGHERLEAACAWALTAGIQSYRGVNNILKHNMDRLERDEPPAVALPAHANIRGQGYYS
jgi:microcystin degradation protein MlrC